MPPAHRHQYEADDAATAVRHERRTWMGGALTFAAAVLELVGGWRTGSAAVAAEGLHMGAHVTAFLLAGLAYALSRRLQRAGRARIAAWTPDAAALANGVLLVAMGGALGLASAVAWRRPEPVSFGPALVLAGFGLAVNLISVALLSHSHAHEAGHGRDMNFRAIYLHILGDTAVGALAIVGLLAGRGLGWRWTDPAAGAVGALLLVILGAQVMVRSLAYLRDGGRRGDVKPAHGAAARRPGVAPQEPIR